MNHLYTVFVSVMHQLDYLLTDAKGFAGNLGFPAHSRDRAWQTRNCAGMAQLSHTRVADCGAFGGSHDHRKQANQGFASRGRRQSPGQAFEGAIPSRLAPRLSCGRARPASVPAPAASSETADPGASLTGTQHRGPEGDRPWRGGSGFAPFC